MDFITESNITNILVTIANFKSLQSSDLLYYLDTNIATTQQKCFYSYKSNTLPPTPTVAYNNTASIQDSQKLRRFTKIILS